MNILRIEIPEMGYFYHSKKGMVDANSLRLTSNINSAQTYSNFKSAKAAISKFKSDLSQTVSLSRWGHQNEIETKVVNLRKKGYQLKVEVLEAKIYHGETIETFSI